MGIVDINPIFAFHPPLSLYTYHPKLKLQNRKKLLGKNILSVLLKCLHNDFQAIFKFFNADKVNITLDKWPILICHGNEVTIYYMAVVLILNFFGKRSPYFFLLTQLVWPAWKQRFTSGGFSLNLTQISYSSIIPFLFCFFPLIPTK